MAPCAFQGLSCLALVALVMASQEVAGAAINPLSIEANNQTCLFDDDCSLNRFCLRPLGSIMRGACTQCWRCCLFPEVWGVCPASCACTPGSSCLSATDCGQGLFCAYSTDLPEPQCQTCRQCANDTQALFGACSDSCPSGALEAAGFLTTATAAADAYVFLAHLAVEVAPDSAPAATTGSLPEADLTSWLSWEGLSAGQVDTMLAAINEVPTVDLPVRSFVDALTSKLSTSLSCPSINSEPFATVVYPGCACNATERAASFRCPAGYRCSQDANRQLSSDALLDPATARLHAVCIACQAGQFCPQGTFIQNETLLTSLDCALGSYCPDPSRNLPCPAGSFCVERTVDPYPCNYVELLATVPFDVLPTKGVTVLERLRDKGDPYKGNYCPINSTQPEDVCGGGYYCPNVAESIICPKGHFCKAQSLSPRPCNLLTDCPEGTVTPAWSNMAFVVLGVVVGALPLMYWMLGYIDSTSTRYEDLERFELKRSRAIKVTRQLLRSIKARGKVGAASEMTAEMQAKYAGFRMIVPRIRLDFEELGLTLPGTGGRVLQGVSGFFLPGKMNAVMGPSGSGKTTFLNVLCGKAAGTLSGVVLVNGKDMPLARTHRVTGFVPQDDIVHEDLSVRENLMYAAHMKLARDISYRRAAVIDDALEMLQLQHVQHYRVGSVEKRGISGGQRKRVNIGLELVGSPSVLFLDEPTSGLDSTASNDILKSLADMAALGMSIIAVIHQPRFSSFMLFDKVLLLGHGGRTVFMGPPGLAVAYFQKGLRFALPPQENPADMLMDIIGGKVTREGDARFKPRQLAEWWVDRGTAWVEEFERLNSTHQGDVVEVEPEMLEMLEDEFDRVDVESTGSIGVAGLMELFEALGQALSVEDAHLLMRRMANQTGRSSVPGIAGQATTITQEQLLTLFESLNIRNKGTGRVDALDRYQNEELFWPSVDVTGDAMSRATSATGATMPGFTTVESSPGAVQSAFVSPARFPLPTFQPQSAPQPSRLSHLVDRSPTRVSPALRPVEGDAHGSMSFVKTSFKHRNAGLFPGGASGGGPLGEATWGLDSPMVQDSHELEQDDHEQPHVYAAAAAAQAWSDHPQAGIPRMVGLVAEVAAEEGPAHPEGQRQCLQSPRETASLEANLTGTNAPNHNLPDHTNKHRAIPLAMPPHPFSSAAAADWCTHNADATIPRLTFSPRNGSSSQDRRTHHVLALDNSRLWPPAGNGLGAGPLSEASDSVLPTSFTPFFAAAEQVASTQRSLDQQRPSLSARRIPLSTFPVQGHGNTSAGGAPALYSSGSGVDMAGAQPRDARYMDRLLQSLVTANSNSLSGARGNGSVTASGHSFTQKKRGMSREGVMASAPSVTQRIGSALRGENPSAFDLVQLSSKSIARLKAAGVAAAAANLPDQNTLLHILRERSFPGFWVQMPLLLRRGAVKYLRSFWPLKVMDTLLLLAAATIIGFIHGTTWDLGSVPTNSVMAMTCLGVLSMVTHLRTFSQHRLLLWRETASGIGLGSHVLAANILDLIWVVTAPAVFLGPYYYLTLPRMPFAAYYVVCLLVCWWASGVAYLLSSLLPSSTVLISGVFVALILGAFVQGLTPTIAAARGTWLEALMALSYNRWAMEILTISEFRYYQDNLRNAMIMIAKGVGLCGVDTVLVDDGQPGISTREAISFLDLQENFTFDSCGAYTRSAYIALAGLGLGGRLVGYLIMCFASKKAY